MSTSVEVQRPAQAADLTLNVSIQRGYDFWICSR